MADSTLLANSSLPRDAKRLNSADDSTGTGTLVSMAAFSVQRP